MKDQKKYEQIARDEAKKSKCNERQVGAILVITKTGRVFAQGHNYSTTCGCNDKQTYSICPVDVIHAEVDCLTNAVTNNFIPSVYPSSFTMFITQSPCNDCCVAIEDFEEEHNCKIDIHVCEQFMKFDDDKVRYDLIPAEWETALAEVLTYGAKKYKPNNWRKGEVDRYIGAVMRHWNAYRKGEINDKDTTMPHLWHMFCNVGFLITLENENENRNNIPTEYDEVTVT